MAAFLEIWKKRNVMLQAVCDACREAEEWREREYTATIKIQSWFRGCRVRAYFQYLDECALMIQKTYRGHYGRRVYRKYLKDYLEELHCQYYDRMATIIQSTWRGYYTRRYEYNYYAQKLYLRELELKNEAIRSQLREYGQREISEQLKRDEELEKLRAVREAAQYHYMLSTESVRHSLTFPQPFFKSPGIFMGRTSPLPIEKEMKSIRFHKPSKVTRRRETRRETNSQRLWPDASNQPAVDLTASNGDCRLRHSLPPINKQQGPFKVPKDIWQKRQDLLKPTLRSSTSFFSVEQARLELKEKEDQKIVVEERFLPFTKSSFSYRQPVFGTQSSFTRPAYGNEHFRDERHYCPVKQRFHTVVPRIPLFDQL